MAAPTAPLAVGKEIGAALAVLCRTSWLPAESRGQAEGGPEDYCVCLLQTEDPSGLGPPTATLPGGALDGSDVAMARGNVEEPEQLPLAVRITALRRTFEAAGMLIGGNPPPSFARQELQQILNREGPTAFHAFLDDWGIRLCPDSLEELACFVEPPLAGGASKANTVHLYLAEVPCAEEAAWAAPGGPGVLGILWATPTEALRLHERGEIELPLPQWYALSELRERLPLLRNLPEVLAAFRKEPLYNVPVRLHRVGERAAREGAEEAAVALALPGDMEHECHPGPQGVRRRILVEARGARGLRALGMDRVGAALVPAARL